MTWTGGGDGLTWSDPNNWGGTLPGPGDDAVIGVVAGNPTIQICGTLQLIQINSLTTSEPIIISNGTFQVATTIQSSQFITLDGGTIQGATITTSGSGAFNAAVGGLDGVTLASNMAVQGSVNVTGGLTLANANVILGSPQSGGFGELFFQGTQTLSGTGQVIIEGASGNNYIDPQGNGTPSGAAVLTIGPNITIDGPQSGNLNPVDNYDTINNEGIINANTGLATLSLGNSHGPVINSGTLEATAGTLNLSGNFTTGSLGTVKAAGGTVDLTGLLDNTGSTLALTATTGSWFLAGGGAITGGAISFSGGAALMVTNGTLSGVTLDSDLTVQGILDVNNGLTLANANLILGLPGPNGAGQVYFDGSQMLGGTGQMIFEGGAGPNEVFPYSAVLTIGPGITVDGPQSGSLIDYYGVNDSIINQGTINANAVGATIALDVDFTNTGTLEATAGTLDLGGNFSTATLGTVDANGGTVNITGVLNNTGSTLELFSLTGSWNLVGGTIVGGAIAGDEPLVVENGTLNGVTLDNDVPDDGALTVVNGLTLNNANLIVGDPDGPDGTVTFLGTQMLGGTGQVIFGSPAGNNILYAQGNNTQPGAAVLTIGQDVTVSGLQNGTLDAYYSFDSINNEGIIEADTVGSAITLNGNLSNTGTVEATAGALILAGNYTTSTLGTVQAAGGTVNLTGAFNNIGSTLALSASTGALNLAGCTVTGGAITSSGSLPLTITNGTLNAVTLDSNVTVEGNSFVTNGMTLNNANLIIGSSAAGGSGDVYFQGTQVLSGTGQVLFGGASGNNNLYTQGNNTPSGASVLTIGPHITVGGSESGNIASYYSYDPFILQGTVNANIAGQTISIIGAAFTDQGALEALNGGKLSINAPLSVNILGLIETSSASTLLVNGDLLGNTAAPTLSDLQGATVFNGAGSAASPQHLEAMSQDLGAVTAGFSNNFDYGTLSLVNNTYVQLVNQYPNTSGTGNEAVYAQTVIVPAGCTLDLNGLNLYAYNVEVSGTVLNGTITQAASPGAGGQFFFTSSSAVVHNTDGHVTVTVTRNFTAPASVAYQTVDDTATSGTEYAATSGTLTFAPNQTQATITVPILEDGPAAATTDFLIQLSNPTNNTSLGAPDSAGVYILNALSGDLSPSVTSFTLPPPAPAADGSITVTLSPPAAGGQWKLFGELDWRNSGGTVTGLTSGNYEVEFKTAGGYQQPGVLLVPLLTGSQASVSGTYTPDGSPSTGSLQVNLAPQGTGGWRFQGETAWRAGGAAAADLNTGDYILEFEPVAGMVTPSNCEAVVYANQLATVSITYLVTAPVSIAGATPVLVSDTIAQTQAPYVFTGQIQTDEGLGTGFVPLNRVVLTAAHVLFDDATLSYVQGVQWFFQFESGAFEAPAQIPAGSYVLSGYASQRASDIAGGVSPGVATTASRQLDVAALYFLQPAALGGQSGYLGGNSADNPWLTGEQDKILAGYPVTGVAPTGFLYATPIVDNPFDYVSGSLFSTTAITSYPGNSGGPLFVRYSDGNFYPAAVYLGGSGETVVHAIDGDVIALLNEAETAGNGGANNAGGGIIQVNEGVSGSLAYAVGSLDVTLGPSGAVAAGAYWELGDGVRHFSGESVPGLAPGSYTVQFFTGPGYSAPASTVVSVTAGGVTQAAGTYAPHAPTITSQGKATAIEGQPFTYQIAVSPEATGYLVSGLPPGLTLNQTTGLISGAVTTSATTGSNSVLLTSSNSQGLGTPFPLALTVALPGELTVTTSGSGNIPKGFVTPSVQIVGGLVSLKATPVPGYLFAYWSNAATGQVLSTQQLYTFTMPQVLNLQANFVVNPFLTAKGAYLALLQGGAYADSGFAQITVLPTGAFTATFNLGGKAEKLTKTFSNLGQYQAGFTLGSGTFNASLALTASGILSGTLTDENDGSQIALYAQRIAPQADQALAGAYTVVLPAPSGAGSLPGGNGFGTVTVSKTGVVTFAGKLGDGIPVTLSGSLDGAAVWPFLYFKAAGKSTGAELLLGTIAFPPAASGTAGILSWYRTSDPVYPGGFATEVPFVTARYTPPAVNYSSAEVIFSSGDLIAPIPQPITILNGKVTTTPASPFKLAFTAKTGLFTGSFEDHAAIVPFAGAVLQSGSSGLGLFQGTSGHTGSVLLQETP